MSKNECQKGCEGTQGPIGPEIDPEKTSMDSSAKSNVDVQINVDRNVTVYK